MMRPRYTAPLVVISRKKGGAYILAELDGPLFVQPVAVFRVIPYFARKLIALPPLDDLLDVSLARLRELEETSLKDTDDVFPDDPVPDVSSDTEGD
jgi:hypothetical protein